MGRAPCCQKVGLKKGRWTAEEDDILTKYILANGEGSWRSLPKNAGLLRCGKSCRLRWINYLRNDLKRGNISSQEEDIIIKLHASLGNKWSLIASQLPGRTDNEIKNYWNSHLSRKIDTFRRPHSEPLPIMMNLGTNTSKKKGGRNRTSSGALKKKKIGKSSSQTVKENGNIENNGVVPSPSTPTLEKDTLPRSIIISQQEQEEKERRSNLVMPSSYQEGMLGSNEERESMVLCNGGEEREARNLMLGPHEGLGSALLSFHDINMSSNEEGGKNKTMVSGDDQERESGVMSCLTKLETSHEELEGGNLRSIGESSGGGEWLSCSSTTSCLEDGRIDWEWKGFVHENPWGNEQELEQEEMLPWLWDSDNSNGKGETQNLGGGMDSEMKEALVAWLLS